MLKRVENGDREGRIKDMKRKLENKEKQENFKLITKSPSLPPEYEYNYPNRRGMVITMKENG